MLGIAEAMNTGFTGKRHAAFVETALNRLKDFEYMEDKA